MDNPACFVLDTNVLSSFYAVGWLDGVACWYPERQLACPSRVWEEFDRYWDADRPNWLDIHEVSLESSRDDYPGSIALADWACIILTEGREDACVVTNDKGIHTVADRRGVAYQWGTAFLLSTFYKCGLSQSIKDEGAKSYVEDLGLSADVSDEVMRAEK